MDSRHRTPSTDKWKEIVQILRDFIKVFLHKPRTQAQKDNLMQRIKSTHANSSQVQEYARMECIVYSDLNEVKNEENKTRQIYSMNL